MKMEKRNYTRCRVFCYNGNLDHYEMAPSSLSTQQRNKTKGATSEKQNDWVHAGRVMSHADFQSGMQIGLVLSKDVRTGRKLQSVPMESRFRQLPV